MLVEARTLRCQAAKDETAMDRNTRHAREPQFLARKRRPVAGGMRNADQPATVGVGPAVIGAPEKPAVAELMLADRCPAMTTAVEERSDAAVAQPRQDDGMPAD